MGATALLGAVAVVAACSGSGAGDGEGASDHITIRMSDDYNTLDPALNTGLFMANNMQMFLYDRLVEVNEDGEIVPHLATEWDARADGATLTLRDDVTCSDGTPLTASDAAASLKRLADPETEAFYTTRVFGQGGLEDIVADDDAGTLEITLKQDYSDLMLGLAQFAASVVCPAGLEDPSILTEGAAGTGPYTLVEDEQQRGVSYRLAKRDDYVWGPKGYEEFLEGSPDTVTFRHVESASTAANLLGAGDVHVAYFGGSEIKRLSEQDFFIFEAWDNGGTGLQFNQAEGLPGADIKFREAILMAINPEAYNEAATFGTGRVSPTPYTFNLPCYSEGNQQFTPEHDVDGAKDLLAEAGWAPGPDGTLQLNGAPTKLRLLGYTDQHSGPDYLLSALQELGFDVDFKKPDLNGWVEEVFTKGDWDLIPYPYTSSFPSPGLFTSNLSHTNFENDSYWESVEAAGGSTGEESCQHWSAAERALMQNYDTMNLSVPVNTWFGNGVSFIAPNNLIWPMSISG